MGLQFHTPTIVATSNSLRTGSLELVLRAAGLSLPIVVHKHIVEGVRAGDILRSRRSSADLSTTSTLTDQHSYIHKIYLTR